MKSNFKMPWHLACGFLLFWIMLFFAVVIPLFYRLPTALTMEDAKKNEFIAERAYKNLYTLSNIGNKIVGSKENEIEAVEFLLKELHQVKEESLKEIFDIEIDLSQGSGVFERNSAISAYQGLQNIAVKLTPKGSTSKSYLLVNSHFDTLPGAGAGDAGFMIVTMLEVFRVMANTNQSFEHPIVFLFNGAEETGLQASHAFITQHKWAPFCKAVVNLDAAGSGGREILFQSGPNQPWLMAYYKKHIKHPLATTLAEEIFQLGLIPSDTDFRQFTTFGNIPGLDMAQCINGFVYHTKYDLIDVIPRESLQNTGDNLLSLIRGLANAAELHNTEAYNTGHTVFFDFLGLYFIHYTETTGVFLNIGVAAAAFILIYISMWRMAAVSQVSFYYVACWFTLVLIIQVISFALGLAFPVIVAYVMDNLGLSLAYYSTPMLVIGLYVCPSLIGLSLPITIFYALQGNKKISTGYQVQLVLHGQALILTVLVFGLTVFGLRSTYIFIIPLVFYVLPLAVNLLTTLHDRGYAWVALHKLSQIIPFLYSSYLFYIFIVVMTPMGGRAGSGSNRDLYIAVLASAGAILSLGLLIPLINTFRRPSYVVISLLVITALSIYLASSTRIGFPYRPKTNVQRLEYLQVRNMFYEYDGTLSKDESGYLFNFEDRLVEKPLIGTSVNLTGWVSIESRCNAHMFCGMPLYDLRFVRNQMYNKWLPRSEPIIMPNIMKLEVLRKVVVNSTTIRIEFILSGPPTMRLFMQPYEDVTISNWSFVHSFLEKSPPYLIFLNYGIDSTSYSFYLECSKANGDFNVPLLQLGVSGHYTGDTSDKLNTMFASTFPSFTAVDTWPAIYKRYIF